MSSSNACAQEVLFLAFKLVSSFWCEKAIKSFPLASLNLMTKQVLDQSWISVGPILVLKSSFPTLDQNLCSNISHQTWESYLAKRFRIEIAYQLENHLPILRVTTFYNLLHQQVADKLELVTQLSSWASSSSIKTCYKNCFISK